jgi:hypothetical protein
MGKIGKCCCACTLDERPFLTASANLFGLDWSVEFDPPVEGACCQTATTECQVVGIDFLADCYTPLEDWYGGWLDIYGRSPPDISLCDQLDSTLNQWVSGCCCAPGEGPPGPGEGDVLPDPGEEIGEPPDPPVDCTLPPYTPWIESRGRFRRRFWTWLEARVTFTVCECLTEDDEIGYRIQVSVELVHYLLSVGSYLIQSRYRMISRNCITGECIVGAYVDESGSPLPPEPTLQHTGIVGLAGCGTTIPASTIEGSNDTGNCNGPPDVIPGCNIVSSCYELDYRHSTYTLCELTTIIANKRFTLDGCAPFGGASTLAQSDRDITHGWVGDCEEDTDPCLTTITLTGHSNGLDVVLVEDCLDEYGVASDLTFTIPDDIAVALTRGVSCPEETAPATSMSLTGYAPLINIATDGALVPFPPTYVVLTTFAPVLQLLVEPVNASLTLALFAPTATTQSFFGPPTLPLTLTTFAPTPITPQTLTPATRSLTLTTFEALLATPLVATPETLGNTLSSFAPTITTPQTLTPTLSTLVISTFAPSLATPITVTPGTDSKTTTVFAPHVSTPQTLTPTTQSLAIATFAPTLNVPQTVTPDVTGLTLATFGPTIINPVETTPATATLVVSAFAPTAATPVVVTPPPLALVIDTETTCELILTTYPPEVTVSSSVGCSCEDPSGTGGFVGDSTVTGCTTDCPGGSCTYLWTGSEWCFLDTTCVPVEGDFNLPPYPSCD